MHERDWKLFLRDGGGKEIAIAQLPARYVGHLGALSDKVYIHHTYAMKAAEKHTVAADLFRIIFDAVEYGEAVADRPRHITFFRFDPESQRWFQVSIKCAADTKRLYLATFHRVKARKVVNRTEKFGTLGP